MKLCYLIYISLLSASFISCDPAYRFIVCNTSKKDKEVQVILPANFYDALGLRDSISLQRINGSDAQSKNTIIAVDKDSLARSYSFILPSQHDALLEFGLGTRPTPNQKIVIDKADTIVVMKKSGRIAKRPKLGLGGEYKLTISD